MNKFYTALFSLFLGSSLQAQELTAQQAMREAMEKNPSLSAALAEKKRAGFAVEVEERRFTTNVAAESKYSHQLATGLGAASDSMIFLTEMSKVFTPGTQLSAGVTLNYTALEAASNTAGVNLTVSLVQPLMQGFGAPINRASLYAAQYNQEASRSSFDSTSSALLRDVLSAYWELWYAQQALKIEERSLETIQAQLKEAQLKIDAGALAPSGSLSLQTEEASIQEQLASAQADVTLRALALSTLLGRGASTSLVATDNPSSSAALPSLEELSSRVEAASFELKQLSANIDLAQLSLRTTKDLKRPKVNAVGQLQLSSTSGDAADAGGQAAGFVGLRFESPASQVGARAEESRALLALSSAQDRFDSTRDLISQQVSTQVEKINTGTYRLSLSEKTAALSAATVAAEKARFDAGVGTALELIRVQQQEREARLRVLRIQVDLVIARLALDHLTGDLLTQTTL